VADPLIRFRPVTPDDLAMLLHWERQPHVVAAGVGDWEWETGVLETEPGCENLIAEREGRPLGFVQVTDPARDASHYWGVAEPGIRAIDIWIGEPENCGHGHGTAIMRLAIARCFADPGVAAIVVDPIATNVRAHGFYERLGFRRVGRRTFGDDDCLVFRLAREAWFAQENSEVAT
jgi:aminoglycoside 6'-N-acetyltransferase